MNYTRKISLIAVALVMALTVTVLLGSLAFAAVPSSSGTPSIVLQTKEVNQGNGPSISVSAQLTNNGKPLTNKPVEFDLAANFFGAQQVNIGTAQTDATGTATIFYQPTWDGTLDFTAHYIGDGTTSQVQVAQTISYSGPVPQYQPEAPGLLSLREWVTPVIYTGVGLFWVFLIVVGAVTFRGIYRAGHQA